MAINNNINNTSDVFYSSAIGDDSSNNLKFSGNSIWNPANKIGFAVRKNSAKYVYISDDASGSTVELELTATTGAINVDSTPAYNGGTAWGSFETYIGSKSFRLYGTNIGVTFNIGDGLRRSLGFEEYSIVSLPLSPCFCAYNSAGDLNQTGNGTLVTVDVDTERFDQVGHFASDTFTASVDGKFYLQGTVTLKGATSANSMHLEIVTTNRTYYGAYCSPSAIKDTIDNDVLLNISTYCDMEKTETAVLKIVANGEGSDSLTINGNATYPITYFSGFLAC